MAKAIAAYPKRIIPKRYFIFISIDKLDKIPNIIISRNSNLSLSDSFDSFDELIEEALIDEHRDMYGLSMNLMGGAFEEEDSQFRTFKDASKDWELHEKICFSDYEAFYDMRGNSFCLAFPLNNLHRLEIPYRRKITKDLRKKLKLSNFDGSLEIPKQNGVEMELKGCSEILHKPTKLNFWHVEFHVRDIATSDFISRNQGKKEWAELMSSWIFNHLFSKNAKKNLSLIPAKIPKKLYSLGWSCYIWKMIKESSS